LREEILFCWHMSGPSRRSPQPPVQCELELFWGVKRPERDFDHPASRCTQVSDISTLLLRDSTEYYRITIYWTLWERECPESVFWRSKFHWVIHPVNWRIVTDISKYHTTPICRNKGSK
jgi:hypothetical protein